MRSPSPRMIRPYFSGIGRRGRRARPRPARPRRPAGRAFGAACRPRRTACRRKGPAPRRHSRRSASRACCTAWPVPFCSAWWTTVDVAAGNRGLDLLAALADDDDALVGAERVDAVEQVQQQRPAGDRVKHLVGVGAHARALPGGQDDDGEAARVGHRARAMAWREVQAPVGLAQRKRAAPAGAALRIVTESHGA